MVGVVISGLARVQLTSAMLTTKRVKQTVIAFWLIVRALLLPLVGCQTAAASSVLLRLGGDNEKLAATKHAQLSYHSGRRLSNKLPILGRCQSGASLTGESLFAVPLSVSWPDSLEPLQAG